MLDTTCAYRVDGYSGNAFRLIGYAEVWESFEDCYEVEDDEGNVWVKYFDNRELIEDESMVIVVPIGDDTRYTVPIEDIHPIGEDEYCPGCGQIGCACYR